MSHSVSHNEHSDDDSTAPTFRQSFSADFDHMFSQLSVSKDQEDNNIADADANAGQGKLCDYVTVIGTG